VRVSHANPHYAPKWADVPRAAGGGYLDLPGHAAAPRGCGAYILGSDASSQMNPEALQRIRSELGLDQPPTVQYFEWIWNALRVDFGHSFWTRQPVIEELGRRYPMTANLACLSRLLGMLIAIPIGVLSAVRQDSVIDYTTRIFSIAGLSLPSIWLAILISLGRVHYFQRNDFEDCLSREIVLGAKSPLT
jgi:ABC-type dipeptide/oligopeptide/nickel transport system permease component